MPGQNLPADALAGCLVVSRMALGEMRSHRDELPEHLAAVLDDAWRVIGPLELPDSAYATAALLLGAFPIQRGFGSI
jgi:hypothetical protein